MSQPLWRMNTRFAAALLWVAAIIGSPTALADQLALDLNDDAARLTFTHEFASGRTQAEGSWLHHQDRGDVIAAGFQLTGNAASQERPINAGLGGRLVYVDAEGVDASGSALAVGGFVDAKIPEYNRFGLGGHIYFAPDVLAFGDTSEFLDLSVHGSYSVLREGEVYVGLRNVRADFDGNGSQTFDTGVHVGFRLNF